MLQLIWITTLTLFLSTSVDPARILGVYPMPFISHQVVFRALTAELVKRGHEVVVITPDPLYKNKESPKNLTEIDISASYEVVFSMLTDIKYMNAILIKRGVIMDATMIIETNKLDLRHYLFQIPEVNNLIGDKSRTFDLVITEGITQSSLIFGEIFDAPVVLFSSLYGTASNYEAVGSVARHPVLYPAMFRDDFGYDIISKIKHLYTEYKFCYVT